MKEIWLICSGCYSDIDWHGFFETEQEAKDYCEWHNNTHLMIGIEFGIVR